MFIIPLLDGDKQMSSAQLFLVDEKNKLPNMQRKETIEIGFILMHSRGSTFKQATCYLKAKLVSKSSLIIRKTKKCLP